MAETSPNGQEKQVKKLKRILEGWREVVLLIHSVLLWEVQWYPGLIFGVVSFVFLLFWLISPNILTAVFSIGIILTIFDFAIPMLIANMHFGGQWNGFKEKLFEDICRNIVTDFNWIYHLLSNLFVMRETSPRWYYSITILALSTLTWIGATIDNVLLCYLLTLMLTLLPGLQQRELPKQYLSGVFSLFNGIKSVKKE